MYIRLLKDMEFREDILNSYLALRETYWTTAAILALIETRSAEIEDSVSRNYLAWPRQIIEDIEDDSSRFYRDSIPAPLVFDEEITKMIDWISQRLELLDAAALATLATLNV